LLIGFRLGPAFMPGDRSTPEISLAPFTGLRQGCELTRDSDKPRERG